jgi:hypothetical protein
MDILASLSSGAVGGLLGGIGTLAKDIRQAITGDLPAEKQAEIQQKIMEIELQAAQGQMAINMEEAKNESIFVSGWRPFVGWVGGFSLAYAAILEPLMTWCATAYGLKVAFPALDTTITMQVLFGILGLGAFRSYDKKQAPSAPGVQ